MPPVDEQKRHELYLAIEASLGSGPAETLMSMIPPTTWDDLVTKDHLSRELTVFEARIETKLHQELRNQTRTLMLGLVGAMATMTSLCLGAIALAQ